MSTVEQDSQPDWNQGWQDVVIGLALSFAFIQAITLAILVENRPAAAATTSALTLVAKILSLALPPVLGYGMYAALATWAYRAHVRMRAAGNTAGVVYGRTIRSPYRLGSVLSFWFTIFGLFATSLFGNAGSLHAIQVTAAILRLGVGVVCAWLAVSVRRDIDLLMGRTDPETTGRTDSERMDPETTGRTASESTVGAAHESSDNAEAVEDRAS